ncbi:hypothetical protein SGPA1_22080 [Streptomyces misionensis JCM 4497]
MAGSGGWVRVRLYCHVDGPEPGAGDHGERYLVRLWPAPRTPPVRPEISEEDRLARAECAAEMAKPVEDYTAAYPYACGDVAG